MASKIPNIIEVCKELNNKMNIILNLKKVHIATSYDCDKEKINNELEYKNKIHEEKINKIIEKYYKILEKTEKENLYKDDVLIILNEVLFCIKIIDICINNIKNNINNTITSIDIIYEIIEFINIFILNYMSDEYDIILNIKSIGIKNIFDKIKIILNSYFHKNNKIIRIITDNDIFIYADEFKLFYVLINIFFNIIENTDKKIKTINVFIENVADKYINNLHIKIFYNDKNLLKLDNNKKFILSNKIIIAHNGVLTVLKPNNITKEIKEIEIFIPIINSFDFLSKNKTKLIKEYIPEEESKSTDDVNVKNSSENNSNKEDANSILNNTKIICVDDSKMNSKFLSYLITTQFFNKDYTNMDVFDNGCELINRIVESQKYNIIFIDNNMPNIKGNIVIKVIRSLGCNSLIIGVTGDNIDVNENDMLKNGANIVYKKPFKKEDMKSIYDFYLINFNVNFTDKKILMNNMGKLYLQLLPSQSSRNLIF